MGRNQRLWTKRDYDFLRDHYSTMSFNDLASSINRTPSAVRARLSFWGLLLEYRRIPGTRFGYRVVVESNSAIRETLPD